VSSQAEIPERPCTSPDNQPECAEPQLTFRDPAGQLQLTRAHALRRVHPGAAEETLAFLASPLRAALERGGDLIPSQIVQPAIVEPGAVANALPAELLIRHPRISPISYPWEWTTAQWRSAAELTLRIASQAIDAGWTLKDATPLNILFVGARPILVDVLSLERRDPNSTTWLAYGQFVRTFLLPLVAEKLLNWPLQTTLFFRDGYEPRAIYEALPRWQRLRPSLLDVVTLATLFEGKAGSVKSPRRLPSTSDPELATHILHKRITRLGRQIRSATRPEASSQWSGYQKSASHYQAADTEAKQQFVRGALERLRPAHVLDIGANTGHYSLMAAEAGAQVVALDSDSAAIAALWQTAGQRGLAVTALVANIARPTPAVGWRNREQLSLLDRLSGQFDLVLMLAVIHHLILREQIPLGHIGDLCSRLTRRWLLLEWVPPSDPMFQEWMRGRDELYGHLTEADLTQAFAPFFAVNDRTVLGNGRILLLFDRKPVVGTQREAATA
jgi:SAM-dependent methyltransferase